MGIFDSDSCKGGDDLLTNLKHISTIHCRISKAKMTYKLSDFWSFCEITCDSLLSHNLKGFYWNQIGLHLTIISIISSSAHYFMINQWINLSIKCQKNSEMGNVQYNFPEPKVTSLIRICSFLQPTVQMSKATQFIIIYDKDKHQFQANVWLFCSNNYKKWFFYYQNSC